MKRVAVAALTVLAALAAVVAVAGRHTVPAGERWVRLDRSGRPSAEVGPGSHWWLSPGGAVVRFPAEPDTLLFPDPERSGSYRLFDRDGIEVATRFAAVYRVERGNGAALARALLGGGASRAAGAGDAGLADTLRARLERSGRPLAAGMTVESIEADGGRALAEALAGAARLEGLTLSVAPHRGGGGDGGLRVLILGVDAADWHIADPLIAAGRMPHLAGLIRRGVRADLHTIMPRLSPLLWTSIATGVTPDRHGILDFLSPHPQTGEMVPVSSAFRRVPAFWNILTQYDVSQGVVAWLATWPAESISGTFVCDRFGFLAYAGQAPEGDRGMTWPPEYEDHARTLDVPAASLPATFWKRFVNVPDRELADLGKTGFEKGNLLNNFALTVSAALTSTAIGEDIQRASDPRVLAVYWELVDAAGHLVMPYAPPRRPQLTERDYERYHGAVDAIYEFQDELLGRMLAHADTANTVVIVLSDHGFKSGNERPAGSAEIEGGDAARWHRDPGILVMAGPGIRRGETLTGDANILDTTPTLLALLGLPVPRTMQGKVLTAAFDAAGATRYAPSYVDSIELREEIWAPPRFDASSAVGPAQASLHNNLGLVMESDGKLAEAEAEYREALRMAPKDQRARNNLGRVLFAQGRTDEALGILEALYRERPDYATVRYNLAVLYQQTGRFAEAEALYRAILAEEPGNLNVEVNLGHTLVRMNRLDEARAVFERALSGSPDEPNAHFGLGLVAATIGDYRTAATEFRRTLELDPGHPSAARNLQAVEQAGGKN